VNRTPYDEVYDEMLKIWAQIEALDELKAKLALFGLTIKELGQSKEPKFQEGESGIKTFYLIDLKKENGKLFWSWTRRNEWEEVTDIHSFLTTYYPPDWRAFITEAMGLEVTRF